MEENGRGEEKRMEENRRGEEKRTEEGEEREGRGGKARRGDHFPHNIGKQKEMQVYRLEEHLL